MALIGENGAGKSTLVKVLSGALTPDSGEMSLDGYRYQPGGPHAARMAGVAMIYQELNLAPDLSVEDNIMLGIESSRWGLLQRRQQRPRVREALRLLGHPELRPATSVSRLSIAARQLIEIARALVSDARVIVFDEPTSSLTRRDCQNLFQVIRRLRDEGLAVIYISHFLEEIQEICDDYCVLRDGASVGAGELAGVTEPQIVSLMVGRDIDDLFPSVPHTRQEPILDLSELTGRRFPIDVSFELHRGEVLGIAGLVGAGRTELLRCLFGLEPVRKGEIRVQGLSPAANPSARIRAGLGLVSEDRKEEGLALGMTIGDNMTLSRLQPYSKFGWLNLGRRRTAVQHWMQRMQVKAPGPQTRVGDLSGGNQQKVALARVLHQDADIFLLDEPTRGIDVGTKSEIYRVMGELAAAGKGVIFVSSYLAELLAVCDRVGVMSRGRLREIRPADQWSEEAVMSVAVAGAGE